MRRICIDLSLILNGAGAIVDCAMSITSRDINKVPLLALLPFFPHRNTSLIMVGLPNPSGPKRE